MPGILRKYAYRTDFSQDVSGSGDSFFVDKLKREIAKVEAFFSAKENEFANTFSTKICPRVFQVRSPTAFPCSSIFQGLCATCSLGTVQFLLIWIHDPENNFHFYFFQAKPSSSRSNAGQVGLSDVDMKRETFAHASVSTNHRQPLALVGDHELMNEKYICKCGLFCIMTSIMVLPFTWRCHSHGHIHESNCACMVAARWSAAGGSGPVQ
jgi:hypothetical protein